MNKEENSLENLVVEEMARRFKNGEISSATEVVGALDKLIQPVLQKMLEIELDGHLEYEKYEHKNNKSNNNSRNGYCKSKTVETAYGQVVLKTPRDRNGTFSPIVVEKGQTRLTGFEDKCITLYAKGMSLRDIEAILTDFYGTKINKDIISKMICTINEETENWRKRPLKPFYSFVFADCLYVPIKKDLVSKKQAIYVIVGIDANGYKDVLGIWIDEVESASIWSTIFEDLKDRGVKDILYVTSDGLAGFKNSLNNAFPITNAQRCVVHLSRDIYHDCPKKEVKEVLKGFKKIYQCNSLEEAQINLEDFKTQFNSKTAIVKKVESYMSYLEPLFELPSEIRKVIYTSNAVESVNSALRKVTNGKGSFPSEEAVYKVLYLRVKDLTKKWNKPIKNWKIIQEQLINIFGERYIKYVNI